MFNTTNAKPNCLTVHFFPIPKENSNPARMFPHCACAWQDTHLHPYGRIAAALHVWKNLSKRPKIQIKNCLALRLVR